MEKTVISKEEAFKKGYLKHKKIYLKPILRGGKMVKDLKHIAFFQIEGGKNWFQLPQREDGHGELINPFSSEEERNFFEQILDLNLSPYGEKTFWHKFFVKVTKDYSLMSKGHVFDLSDPMDVLRYKVAKFQNFVSPDWDHAYSRPEYRFALVDEDYETQREVDSSEQLIEAYTYFGTIKNSSPKMKDFLGMYFNEKREMKFVPVDADKEWLKKEIKKIIDEDIATVLKIIEDQNAPIKLLILNAMRAGAIEKEARNKYKIKGEGVSYTYEELVDYLKTAESVKDDVYLKLVAVIDMKKK